MTSNDDQIRAAQSIVDQWPIFLDAIDGMIAQTVARGFTHAQARTIITGLLSGAGQQRP